MQSDELTDADSFSCRDAEADVLQDYGAVLETKRSVGLGDTSLAEVDGDQPSAPCVLIQQDNVRNCVALLQACF